MSDNRRFGQGWRKGGTFTCESCGHLTRATNDGAQNGLCGICWDYAGWQNAITDNGNGDGQLGYYLTVCRRLERNMVERGGDVRRGCDCWAEISRMDDIHELALTECAPEPAPVPTPKRTRTPKATTDPWRETDRQAKAAGFRQAPGRGYRAALVAFCVANGIAKPGACHYCGAVEAAERHGEAGLADGRTVLVCGPCVSAGRVK